VKKSLIALQAVEFIALPPVFDRKKGELFASATDENLFWLHLTSIFNAKSLVTEPFLSKPQGLPLRSL
jgi:hypothetical protein